MAAIERDNPSLKGVLPKDYARPALDKQRLGELIDLIGNIGLGDAASRAKDMLGRVYEYFLVAVRQRRGQEGRRVLHAALRRARCWSRCSSRTRAASTTPAAAPAACSCSREKFVEAHGGRHRRHLRSTARSRTTPPGGWRKMNLAIRGIEANLGPSTPTPSTRDLHPDLKADYVLANPPFNDQRLGRRAAARRRALGVRRAARGQRQLRLGAALHPPPGARPGIAGFVLANGSMSSNQSGEGEIRKAIVEADLVDCMVALPGQLFYSTQIPVCLWFLARDKKNGTLPRPPRRDALHRRPQAGHAGRPHPPRADRRRHRPDRRHLPRLARRARTRASTPTSPASARARRSRRSASTATCSRPAATSARRTWRTTASRSRRRCSGSPRRCASSRPRPRSWTPPSRPT